MTYELIEYNQDENNDDTYNHKANHPLFYTMRAVKLYIILFDVYGKVFEYDDTEYANYHSIDDDYMDAEAPEPTNEWVTSDLVA